MSMPTMIAANDVPPRLAERFSPASLNMRCREPWRVLLPEEPSTIACVPDYVANPTKPNMIDRYPTRAKNVIGWSIRLIVHRSATQHEKPDAPCRVRRRVGPPRHRHWRASPSGAFSKTRATLKADNQSRVSTAGTTRVLTSRYAIRPERPNSMALLGDSTRDRPIARSAKTSIEPVK